jgi:hypothetical protein
LGCFLFAFVALAPARSIADEPAFCHDIQAVIRASRTDFDQWQGKVRPSTPSVYDTTYTLPRATDCRIERQDGSHYTCDWTYGEDEGGRARAAEAVFLEALLDCFGAKVGEVHPSQESEPGRRRMTRLVVHDDAATSAELRVSSGLIGNSWTWYVEFSANRRR